MWQSVGTCSSLTRCRALSGKGDRMYSSPSAASQALTRPTPKHSAGAWKAVVCLPCQHPFAQRSLPVNPTLASLQFSD